MVEHVHVTQVDPEVVEFSIQLLTANPDAGYLASYPNLIWINTTDGKMYRNNVGTATALYGNVHSHTVAEVTDFDPSSKASVVHSHTQAQIVDLDAAPTVHSHTQAQIVDLDAAPTVHSHTISEVSNLDKGSPNGVASLDAGGKIPVDQLPSSIMEYLGTWDAETNAPTLADGDGDVGDVYRVSVGGEIDLGSGSQTFNLGDFVIYNVGSIWEQSGTNDAVVFDGNEYEFTATGVLTAASTAYACFNIGPYPKSVVAIQKLTGKGWGNVDTIGTLVWVTDDGNKYLQGDIDSLNPSVAEPVKIIIM